MEDTSSDDDDESNKKPSANGNTSTIISAAAGGIPSRKGNSGPSAELALEKRTPSRNARRKANKRKLRRLGVLPGNTGKKSCSGSAPQNGSRAADGQTAVRQKGGNTAPAALQSHAGGGQAAGSQKVRQLCQIAGTKPAKGRAVVKGVGTAGSKGLPAPAPKNVSKTAGGQVQQSPLPPENGRCVILVRSSMWLYCRIWTFRTIRKLSATSCFHLPQSNVPQNCVQGSWHACFCQHADMSTNTCQLARCQVPEDLAG